MDGSVDQRVGVATAAPAAKVPAAAVAGPAGRFAAAVRARPMLTLSVAYGLLLVYAGTPSGRGASSLGAAKHALLALWSRLPVRRP